MKSWLNLEGNIVIVTGGSSGIGRAIVEELSSQNVKVVVADLNDINCVKDNVYYKYTDISSKQSISDLVDWTYNTFGRIDALVNNAGINLPRLLVDHNESGGKYELEDKIFDKMIDVNLKGAFIISQCVARYMVKTGNGVIINVSSESGLEGSEGQSCYAATKAALNSFTRSWSKELGKHGIRVVGIAPGIMEKTGLRTLEYEEALAYTRGITVEKLREGYTKNSIPIGRDGKLSEVADAVAYFISNRASYITGITCNVAGGKTRG